MRILHIMPAEEMNDTEVVTYHTLLTFRLWA